MPNWPPSMGRWWPPAGAAVDDAGAVGYSMVVHRLVDADPVAWSSDVHAILHAVGGPEFAAYHLAAAAVAAHRPGTFPHSGRPPLPRASSCATALPTGLDENCCSAGQGDEWII
ncbi:hypothetical protein ACFCY8_11330 [Streptomyces noursei]|uniref:hypothetical protein n=1 Tax=Streptomyces noursei TaxID=1971 RepID=UPI0035E26598